MSEDAPIALPAPLTPADCDLRRFPDLPFDVGRVLDSDLFALSTPEEFKVAFALWAKSWHQVPAASLPSDDRILCRLAGTSLVEWEALKAMALRGWVLCSDGRLYHEVIAEKASKAWARRQEQAGRARKRWEKARTAQGEEAADNADANPDAHVVGHATANAADAAGMPAASKSDARQTDTEKDMPAAATRTRARRHPWHRDIFEAARGPRIAEPEHLAGLDAIDQWVNAGATLTVILTVIARKARKSSTTVSSWHVFTPDVLSAIEDAKNGSGSRQRRASGSARSNGRSRSLVAYAREYPGED